MAWEFERPLTQAAAWAHARTLTRDPDVLAPCPHPDFESDLECGGFAFFDGQHILTIVDQLGAYGCHYVEDERAAAGIVDQWWDRARHAGRALGFDGLGPWQQVAVTAIRQGRLVRDLDDDQRRGLSAYELNYAEYLRLRIAGRKGLDPLRVLAADDTLMEPPRQYAGADDYVHDCPICGRPAIHQARYPRNLCEGCYARTTDSKGRRVRGYNTALLGSGFEARLLDAAGDAGEVCEEVTRSGRCWVDGHACYMREAYMGGVVVEALAPPS